MSISEDFDIMGNMKLIENYRTFLLSSVADLFVTMAKGAKADLPEITEEIAEIIILSYLLGKRLEIDFSSIDDKIIKKLKIGLASEGDADRQQLDYANLITYLKSGRTKAE